MSRKNKRRNQIQAHPQNQKTQESIQSNRTPRSNPVTTIERHERHEGPLPHPSILRQYDEIVPEGANRIFVLMETQTAHRISMERSVILGDNKRANWGVACAAFLALCFLAVGGFLVYKGHDVAGATIVTSDLGGFIGVFIYGTISRRQERVAKAEKRTA